MLALRHTVSNTLGNYELTNLFLSAETLVETVIVQPIPGSRFCTHLRKWMVQYLRYTGSFHKGRKTASITMIRISAKHQQQPQKLYISRRYEIYF